jgi:hypothetical protein
MHSMMATPSIIDLVARSPLGDDQHVAGQWPPTSAFYGS